MTEVNPPFRYGSVCSGIEAATCAWHSLGWKPAWYSEIEPFPCAVLKHHYPDVPNNGDMTKYEQWNEYEQRINLLVGGTPCQSFSLAGLRKGLADPRGNLMLTFGAIAAKYRPQWLVWENVPGVLSSNGGKDFASFLGLLTGQVVQEPSVEGWKNSGVLSGIGSAYGVAWRVLDAQYFGVAQRRRRVFVVAHIGGLWQRAAAVLFERASLCRDTTPSRCEGEGTPARPTVGALCSSSLGRQQQQAVEAGHYVPDKTHSLRGEGFDASEDGTGRGTPIVPVGQETHAFPWQSGFGVGTPEKEISPTLIKNQVMAVHCADVAPTLGKESMSPTKSSSGQMADFAIVQEVQKPVVIAGGQANSETVVEGCPTLTCRHDQPILFTPADQHKDVPPTVGALTAQGDGGRAGQDANSGQAIPVQLAQPPRPALSIPGNWIDRQPHNGGNGSQPGREIAPALTKMDRHAVLPPDRSDVLCFVCKKSIYLAPGGCECSLTAENCCEEHSIRVEECGCKTKSRGVDLFNGAITGDVVPTVSCGTGGEDSIGPKVMVKKPVSLGEPVNTTGHQGDRVVGDGDVFPCLSAQGGNNGGGPGALMLTSLNPKDIAPAITASNDPSRSPQSSEVTQRVAAVLGSVMAVRRLTPMECERLQAFPDNYTKIPWAGKDATECPDGPRYKALGNSMCVGVMNWIGKRIQEVNEIPFPK